jgi:N-acetylglucosaminyldiphosphoundecaprenol N-acetyl-beta-D-mannosaminyltransferase
MEHINLMGMTIDVVTERQAVARIVDGHGGVTVTPNLDHLRRFRSSEAVRRFYARADLVPADGMPLVWASRILGTPLPERVAGSDLIWSVSEAAAARGAAIALVGGSPGSADAAARVLTERFPDLRVALTACPLAGFEDDAGGIERLGRAVAGSGARIVFVGLPLDKQIALIEPLRASMPEASLLGVGVSFSFVCGEVARAPRWMQRLGIEWLHRLAQEPRRLARRYLIEGLPFAARLLAGAGFARVRGGRPAYRASLEDVSPAFGLGLHAATPAVRDQVDAHA